MCQNICHFHLKISYKKEIPRLSYGTNTCTAVQYMHTIATTIINVEYGNT